MINAFPSIRIVDGYFIGQASNKSRILVFTKDTRLMSPVIIRVL